MKTFINNSAEYVMEMVRRTLYSLQVLVLVMAVPVLFITGIANRDHKASPKHVTETGIDRQLGENAVYPNPIVKI